MAKQSARARQHANEIKNFWKNVERYRALRGYTVGELCSYIEMNPSTYHNYVSANSPCAFLMIFLIANALEILPQDLFDVWTDEEWLQCTITYNNHQQHELA